MRILKAMVLDDDRPTRDFLKAAIEAQGHACESFPDPKQAEAYLRANTPDLVMVDVYLGEQIGIDLVEGFRKLRPDAYYVVMTAQVSVETAARAISQGAVEYVKKPIALEELRGILARASSAAQLERNRPLPPEEEPLSASSIIGRSAAMVEVYRTIARVAPSNVNVLILGASGTGKELVARAIHQHSKRGQLPFTAVNCGSFTETILESELFGHEKGAFTGADSTRKGLIESTNGGTLFLDEITETSLGFQVRLLRVIQEQQVRRVGANSAIPVNVRILAASNRDLHREIAQGRFREDLFYRLAVVQIALPPLDSRREDIPLLVTHFLSTFNKNHHTSITIESAAVSLMESMLWPGNVRELENTIQRLAIFAESGIITRRHVEEHSQNLVPTADSQLPTSAGVSDRLLDQERAHIMRVLEESHGNRSEAARRLGIERKTLYKKAARLGINLPAQK